MDEEWATDPTYKRLLAEFPDSHITCLPDFTGAYHECALHSPHILLISDHLKGIAPIEFAREFRKRAGLNEPLIVLVGRRGGHLAEYARCFGIDVFIPKPVDTPLFMAMLHQAVDLRAARIALAGERVHA